MWRCADGSTCAPSPTCGCRCTGSSPSGSTPLLLDLGEAHVGDATGFGLIVECQRRARRAGRPMRIVAADDRTRRLLRRARLGSLLGTRRPRRSPAGARAWRRAPA